MLEKTINLPNISLVDFLGVQNQNIKEIASAFPESKIISRGNQIKIKGSGVQIYRIQEILNSLISRYDKFGSITHEEVIDLLGSEDKNPYQIEQDEILVFGTKGLKVKAKTPNQALLINEIKNNDLVFATGPAGTGKTYISVALAVKALKNKTIRKIIITRPAVEAGESLGFLPGDLEEKIDPYLRPIHDALNDMIQSEKLRYYRDNGTIEIAPLAYMRGRTLNNAFILLDEAQNTTPNQIKMFLTRMGPSSKVIVTGDTSQIDLPGKQKSGLVEAMLILKNVEGIGFVALTEKDVVRHKLIKRIIKAYHENQNESINNQK